MVHKKKKDDEDEADQNNAVYLCFKRYYPQVAAYNDQKDCQREPQQCKKTYSAIAFFLKTQCKVNKILFAHHLYSFL